VRGEAWGGRRLAPAASLEMGGLTVSGQASRLDTAVLGMQRSDVESYAGAWRARFQAAEQARADRAAVARALLPRLVQHLAERYGVRRVWLYGSLAEGGFHEHSDIDLAAEGFPPGSALFRAGAELEELARPFTVDLVPLEDARPSVQAHILQAGELLYDGDQT
jgi:predicted nucleotidyltransferase